MKNARGIATTPYTSYHFFGEFIFRFEDLPTRFPADHRLKLPYHERVRMRPGNGTGWN